MTLIEQHETYNGDAELKVGEVLVLSDELVSDIENHPYFRRMVRVGDESDLDPERKASFNDFANHAEKLLVDNPEWKRTIIRQKTKEVIIAEDNLAARWLYLDNEGNPTQMMDWAKDFPTAIALEPLQRLERGGRRLEKGHLDERTLELFTYMIDAIGIRSRAHIYAQRLVELADNVDGPLSIISVGSGAAVPNIEATLKVEALQGKYVNWQFFDLDPNALAFAHELIEEAKFEKSAVEYGPVSMDTEAKWHFEGRSYEAAFEAPNESVDVVDALGLWEYLRDGDAEDFARELYAKVKSGGMMIISNMLVGRPQSDFNKRGVGWPPLVRRSEEDLIRVLTKAGIDSRNITMTHAQDGVYVVVEIQKP